LPAARTASHQVPTPLHLEDGPAPQPQPSQPGQPSLKAGQRAMLRPLAPALSQQSLGCRQHGCHPQSLAPGCASRRPDPQQHFPRVFDQRQPQAPRSQDRVCWRNDALPFARQQRPQTPPKCLYRYSPQCSEQRAPTSSSAKAEPPPQETLRIALWRAARVTLRMPPLLVARMKLACARTATPRAAASRRFEARDRRPRWQAD
jgi:hypothetical protein